MKKITPSAPLERLLDLIHVEPIGGDRFRGQSEDIGTPAVFGGQVLGQALMAAALTAPEGRVAHSLHAYFLLPGQHEPIDYAVERVRDGGSCGTRRVVARQQGSPIFEMAASFNAIADGLDRHHSMPPVPGPEGIRSEMEHRIAIADRRPPHCARRRSSPAASSTALSCRLTCSTRDHALPRH
jgi:acyl-CoA thioesterase-2